MYVLSTGCQWRAVPKNLPPSSTLYDYFERWNWEGTLDRIHDTLYVQCREAAAREASPTAAIIDSQSVKGAEKGGPASIRPATMRARRSRARSGTCLSIRRPADARDRAFRRHPRSRRRGVADGEPVRRLPVPDQALCRRRLPRAGIPERVETHSRARRPRDHQAIWVTPKASSSCPSAGSSNAPSPGSAAAADSPRIGNASTARPSPSCASPQSASCCESYAIPHDVSGQTLSVKR